MHLCQNILKLMSNWAYVNVFIFKKRPANSTNQTNYLHPAILGKFYEADTGTETEHFAIN